MTETIRHLRPTTPPPTTDPPHHPESEAAILGAILRAAQDHPDLATDLLTTTPPPGDYYRPHHETLAHLLHTATTNNQPISPTAVLGHLTEQGHFKVGYLDGATLHTLLEHAPNPAELPHHTRRVQQAARLRRTQQALTRAQQQLTNQQADTTADVLLNTMETIEDAFREETTGHTKPRITVRNIDQILNTQDPQHDWIIPNLLERGDRLIITGPEGGGKSTLLRQLAIQTAAGIHPFTGELITPLRVLYIDCENSERQFRRKTSPLRTQAADLLNPDNLRISFRLDGIDLTNPNDTQWLDHHVAATQPDLLITGPIYKLANGDPTEEKSAKPVALALDRIRADHGCAVLLEAHSSKALGGSKKRAHEPYGWSGWLRWPEFGIWLDTHQNQPTATLEHWRGQRDERDWPTILERGGHWPWTPVTDENTVRWNTITSAIRTAGKPLSQRDIVMATGIPKTTVIRVLGQYAMQYQALIHELGGDPQ